MGRIQIRFHQAKYDKAPAQQLVPYTVKLTPISKGDTIEPGRVIKVDGNLYGIVQGGAHLPEESPLRRAALESCVLKLKETPGVSVSSEPVPIPLPQKRAL